MGVGSGSQPGAARSGTESDVTDDEVRQIASMADQIEMDQDEIDAIGAILILILCQGYFFYILPLTYNCQIEPAYLKCYWVAKPTTADI